MSGKNGDKYILNLLQQLLLAVLGVYSQKIRDMFYQKLKE
jgi:hypothetical protein